MRCDSKVKKYRGLLGKEVPRTRNEDSSKSVSSSLMLSGLGEERGAIQISAFLEERDELLVAVAKANNEVRALGQALHSLVSGGSGAVARRQEQPSQLFQMEIHHPAPAPPVPQCWRMSTSSKREARVCSQAADYL